MRDVLRRYHQISHELEHSQNNDLIKELNTLQNQIEAQNGWQFDAAIRQTIGELGLPENERIGNLSGGQKKTRRACPSMGAKARRAATGRTNQPFRH